MRRVNSPIAGAVFQQKEEEANLAKGFYEDGFSSFSQPIALLSRVMYQ